MKGQNNYNMEEMSYLFGGCGVHGDKKSSVGGMRREFHS